MYVTLRIEGKKVLGDVFVCREREKEIERSLKPAYDNLKPGMSEIFLRTFHLHTEPPYNCTGCVLNSQHNLYVTILCIEDNKLSFFSLTIYTVLCVSKK